MRFETNRKKTATVLTGCGIKESGKGLCAEPENQSERKLLLLS